MPNQKLRSPYMTFAVVLLICVPFLGPLVLPAAAEPLWKQLSLRKRIEADPTGDYTLTDQHGPWLILAASFSGAQGEQQARELVLELRRKYGIVAYYYGRTFQLSDSNPGRGLDAYGGRIKRRIQRGDQVVEHAVLAGEFPSIDDPAGQKMLQRIKTLKPSVLETEASDQTSQSLATVRQYYNKINQKLGKQASKGPMSHAFFSSNPLLPREYFVPKGVSPDIAKWNKGLKYSLLNCPGRYSIRVATFGGRTTIKQDEVRNLSQGVRQASADDPLVIASKKAHLLTVALREKGWDAYEFHNRKESFVTVGSFDQGRQLSNGHIAVAEHNADIIINTFGAASPKNVFNKPARQDKMRAQQVKEQFNTLFSHGQAQLAQGFHPKQFVGIPFDIIPEPIEVPKQTISSAYVRN
jgi:hypothetical protein